MTYQEAREFIDQSNQYGNKLGLTAITELLRRLGNPQDRLKVIHVAGTNGKGSTTAFIATILASQGYRVGRYISPAVFSYLERVQITGKKEGQFVTDYLTEQGVTDSIAQIKPICEDMLLEGLEHPTAFEIETVMALLYLVAEKVDFAVIEVGLGGRLDATNVFQQPLCCVITSISMDHMQYLGDTLSKIATEKAGIIKKGSSVITGNSDSQVYQVISDACREKGAKLSFVNVEAVTDIQYSPEGTSFTFEQQRYHISQLGDYQIYNALLAIHTVQQIRELGYAISDSSIQEGVLITKWRGRFEILAKDPYFIIDGAHNEDAAYQLRKTIEAYFTGKRLIYIMGVLADKAYDRILQITAPLADLIITITPDNDRALASKQLALEAKRYSSCEVYDAGFIPEAIRYAYDHADQDDVILAFGSLSYLGEVSDTLLRCK